MTEGTEKKTKDVSRRKFLVGAGASLAGMALMGGVSGLLTGCEAEEPAANQPNNSEAPPVSNNEAPPAWPVQYVKLDPDKAAEKGYQAYYDMGG